MITAAATALSTIAFAIQAYGAESAPTASAAPSDVKTAQPIELQAPTPVDLEHLVYGYPHKNMGEAARLLFAGRKQLSRGQLMGAYKTFKQVLQAEGRTQFDRNYEHALAYFSLADCYIKERNFEMASKLLESGAQLLLPERTWEAKFARSRLQSAQGNREAAIAEMEQAVTLAENVKCSQAEPCREYLAQLYADEQKYELAANTLSGAPARKLPDQDFKVRTAIAYYFAKAGKNQQSEKVSDLLCSDILRNQSQRRRTAYLPLAARNRAVLLRKLGDEAGATMWMQKANELEAEGKTIKATGKEPDFSDWMPAMQRKIKGNWYPPKGYESKRVVVRFQVTVSGQMEGLELISGTGNAQADDAALEAVRKAAPLAPLPQYADDTIDIRFTFDYNVFGR